MLLRTLETFIKSHRRSLAAFHFDFGWTSDRPAAFSLKKIKEPCQYAPRQYTGSSLLQEIGGSMSISELLLTEFDEEMKKTRTTLERVPADRKDFAPHSKSMPLGKLAPHVAQLAGFGLTILTTPAFDFSAGNITPLPFESSAQLVKALDDGAAKVRAALQATPDSAWTENWKLSLQ